MDDRLIRRQEPRKHIILYHYTNKTGYDSILKSNAILIEKTESTASTQYGFGVYLTDIPPDEAKSLGWVQLQQVMQGLSPKTTLVEKDIYYIAVKVNVDQNLVSPQESVWLCKGTNLIFKGKVFTHDIRSINQEHQHTLGFRPYWVFAELMDHGTTFTYRTNILSLHRYQDVVRNKNRSMMALTC